MKADLVLARAPNLTLDVLSNGVVAYPAGRKVRCGPHGLAILAAFETPRRYGDVIAELGKHAATPADWIALTASIQEMVQLGALRDVARIDEAPDAPTTGYEHPGIHIEMLNDKERTAAFIRGIKAVVKPGDVVVDIGTGTGVLAIAAAQAGAARVYAIEASRIADAAEAVIRGNGLQDRVSVVRGWSTRVELPERADVLVTEMIGHEPLAEDALLVTWDARKRLLKEGARMVPRALRMYAYPAILPEDERGKAFFTEASTLAWKSWYGIDFSALLGLGGPRGYTVETQEVKSWTALAEPALIGAVDFTTCDTIVELKGGGKITRAGHIGAIVLYFDLELAPGVVLSTAPAACAASNHWRTPVWFPSGLPDVAPGQAWEVSYRHSKPMGDLDVCIR